MAEPPATSYIFPAGGKVGSTVSVNIGGLNFHGAAGFEVLGTGIQSSATVKETNTFWIEGPIIPQPASQRSEDYPKDHAGQIQIATNAAIGIRHWRCWTSQGAVPAMKFVIGDRYGNDIASRGFEFPQIDIFARENASIDCDG